MRVPAQRAATAGARACWLERGTATAPLRRAVTPNQCPASGAAALCTDLSQDNDNCGAVSCAAPPCFAHESACRRRAPATRAARVPARSGGRPCPPTHPPSRAPHPQCGAACTDALLSTCIDGACSCPIPGAPPGLGGGAQPRGCPRAAASAANPTPPPLPLLPPPPRRRGGVRRRLRRHLRGRRQLRVVRRRLRRRSGLLRRPLLPHRADLVRRRQRVRGPEEQRSQLRQLRQGVHGRHPQLQRRRLRGLSHRAATPEGTGACPLLLPSPGAEAPSEGGSRRPTPPLLRHTTGPTKASHGRAPPPVLHSSASSAPGGALLPRQFCVRAAPTHHTHPTD